MKRWSMPRARALPRRRSLSVCAWSFSASSTTSAIPTPSPFPIPSLSTRSSCRWPLKRKKTGKAACRCRACAAWCRDSAAFAIPGSTREAARSIAKRQASTPASYSTNAIISTASCIRCACATCARWDSPACYFPVSKCRTSDRTQIRSSLQPQLIVERLLELEQRCFVMQARSIEQEHVLGAFAQGVDLRAFDVDVGARQNVGDAREQARPVAGDDLENEMRSLVVGKDANFRGQGEVLEVAADSSGRRGPQRRAHHQRLLELVLDEAHRLAVGGIGIARIVDVEGIERIAVARGVDPRLENRQLRAAEETANAREEFLLIGEVDHDLQPGALAREAGLDHRFGTVDAKIEMALLPCDFVAGVALEIDPVQTLPELLLGTFGNGVQAQAACGFGSTSVKAVLQPAPAQVS